MDYSELKYLMSLQKEEMTPGERIKAYKAGKDVDILPYVIFSPDLAFTNLLGFTTKQFSTDIDVKCEVIRRRREEFQMNTFNVGLGLKTIGHALGSKMYVPEIGVDYVEDHVLKSYEKLDCLEIVDSYNNSVLSPILKSAKRLKEVFPDLELSTSVAGPFSTAISIRPVEMVLRDTRKNPEKLHQLLDLTVQCSLNWVEAFYNEFGQVGVSFSDPVTSMDILGKKQFDDFSAPHLKDLIDGVEKIMGARPGAHICGHTKKIWNDLADMGLANLSLDNNEDLEEAKRIVGNKMSISGNIDPVGVMLQGTIDDVIEAVKECIKKCADNPKGYTLSFGCQLPIGVSRENIDAYIYAARKYGKKAKMGELPKGILEEL